MAKQKFKAKYVRVREGRPHTHRLILATSDAGFTNIRELWTALSPHTLANWKDNNYSPYAYKNTS